MRRIQRSLLILMWSSSPRKGGRWPKPWIVGPVAATGRLRAPVGAALAAICRGIIAAMAAPTRLPARWQDRGRSAADLQQRRGNRHRRARALAQFGDDIARERAVGLRGGGIRG